MNETSFLQLIEQHQRIIHKICHIYRDSKEDREDLFQEIVFQLWKSFPAFEGKSKPTSWMYRIALNTAIAGFRKKRPDISYASELPEQEADQQNENELYRKEQLFHAVTKLNDAEKAIMALYFEEMSYQEISEITGISENYVGVKMNRIKTKIQKLLKTQ